jgi:tetratricopeptide (TPR) repeat protein
MRKIVFGLLVLMAACGPKTVPLPTVSLPQFPDFVAPVIPAEAANTVAAELQLRGWTFLQAGDLKNAEREFTIALKVTPAFSPAETGLGYVEIARRDHKAALAHFGRVLERQPADVSALVGRGEASLALGREDEALVDFGAAAAADPARTEIAQRVEVLKFRVAQQRLANARTAANAGRLDDAIRAYTAAIASSPGSAFLYRELALIEKQKGEVAGALAHFRTAIDLDPADAASLTGIGDILEAGGDFDAAAKTYADALAIEPSAAVQTKLEAARAKAELARLPAEYRAIDAAPQITRGELAALIGVRLGALLQPAPGVDAEPITDIRNDWASSWILTVARAGVMEPFANHAFQPRAIVRRVDLAQAVERLLARIAPLKPAAAGTWESSERTFPDLAPAHLAYPAAKMAVAAGVLTTAPDGSFEPSRVVTGAEAVETVRRLEALAGLPPPGSARR